MSCVSPFFLHPSQCLAKRSLPGRVIGRHALCLPLLLAPLTVSCKTVFAPQVIGRHVLCLSLLLAPLTVSCKTVFVRPDDRETVSVPLQLPWSSPSSCSPHSALQNGLCHAGPGDLLCPVFPFFLLPSQCLARRSLPGPGDLSCPWSSPSSCSPHSALRNGLCHAG